MANDDPVHGTLGGMQTSRLPAAPAVRRAPAVSTASRVRAVRRVRAVSQARAVAALAASGVAWGTSVPLSKAALSWLPPAWLVVARFAVAAAVLLAVVDRPALRAALRWQVLAWGAAGLGGSVLVQNMGLARTSVTHAALLIGTGPVLVAVIAAAWYRDVARPVAWAGFAVSVGGVAVVASGQAGGATGAGDALVVASVLIVAAMTVAQGRLLEGQDPAAITAVQFLGAAVAALPVAACTAPVPPVPPAEGAGALAVLAAAGLASVGTLVPFTLFAYGQRTVPTEVAGAFLNLEPLVGSLTGVVAFGDPAGARLFLGGAAIVGGIAMSSLPALHGRPTRPPAAAGDAVTRAATRDGSVPAVLYCRGESTRAQGSGDRPGGRLRRPRGLLVRGHGRPPAPAARLASAGRPVRRGGASAGPAGRAAHR